MARIAVVDMIFCWPPDGGARVALHAILQRLAKHHEICLFVPHMTWKFPRGVIKDDPGFSVELIPCTLAQYNPVYLGSAIARRVDQFRPDLVWMADGWTIKPYIINRLAHHRLWNIFYAYEMLCPLDHGRFRRGVQCKETVLTAPWLCYAELIGYLGLCLLRRRFDNVIHESMVSLAFIPGYSSRVKAALAACHRHIVHSPHYLDLLKGFASRVTIIPEGVNTDHFVPSPLEGQGVLMVGRVEYPAKGLSVLLRALDILKEKGVATTLRVTGSGDFGPEITSVGWISHLQLPDLYRDAAVVVVPSVWEEPFGLVAAEAMACGIPVIASNRGGLAHIVKDGETGLLFKAGDAHALAEKLQLVLQDEHLRQRLGCAARARAEALCRWDAIVHDYYLPLINQDVGTGGRSKIPS